MQRAAASCELTAVPGARGPATSDVSRVAPTWARDIRFQVAGIEHDGQIRRLQRQTPMPGAIRLTLQREPSHFGAAAQIEGDEHRTLVGMRDDRVICAGSVSIRRRFLNGQPTRIGYLSGLRLDRSYHGRAEVVRRGYDAFRKLLHDKGGPEIYFTSIAADNVPARRFLERGARGMPTYTYLNDFTTLLIEKNSANEPCDTSFDVRPGHHELAPAILDLLNGYSAKYQFGPVLCARDLALPGFHLEDLRLLYENNGADKPVACAALWDQRAFKQTVVNGYSQPLRALRPLFNAWAVLRRRPRLPGCGQAVAQAFVSHVAVAALEESAAPLGELLRQLLRCAPPRSLDYLCIGLDARDRRLAFLQSRFRCRKYTTRLYAVHLDEAGARLVGRLDPNALIGPEVGLL